METQYISLNMTPTGVNPCFHISQYDVGRMLGFIVHSGGATVDLDTYTCTIEATRSDGTAITSAVATTDNIGTFEVTPTMSNKTDKYRCQLVIVDANSKRIASLPFDMDVCKAAMDENSESIEEDASLYQQYTKAVQGAIAEANADIQAEENARIAAVTNEKNERIAAVNAEATARQTADNTLQDNINSEASTRAAADAVLQGQIDNFVQLPSGSTAADAELANIRVKADGTSATTAGNAVREQFTELKNDLKSINEFTRKQVVTTKVGSLNTTSGSSVPSNTHLVDVNIPNGTEYSFKLISNGNVTKYHLYANGGPIKYNCDPDTEYTITASSDITWLSIYAKSEQVVESGEITGIVTITTDTEDSLEEKIEITNDDLSSLKCLVDANVIFCKEQFNVGSTINNDGNATHIYKEISFPINADNMLGIFCDGIDNYTSNKPIVVYHKNSGGTVVKTDYFSESDAKHGIKIIPNTNATNITVNLYPSITGGLTTTPATYHNINILWSIDGTYSIKKDSVPNMYGVPFYYVKNSYLDDKIDVIETLIKNANGNCDTFIFCTDQHWTLNAKQSPNLINYICQSLNIKRMFMGGDYADGINLNALKAYRDAFDGKIYDVIGNHEYMNYLARIGHSSVSQNITSGDIYAYINLHMTDAVSGDFGRGYYYIDNAMQKMRYIVLSVYADNGDGATAQFESAQKTWLQTVALGTTPNDFTVVIFAHYLYSVEYSTGAITPASATADILEVVDAYNGDIACMVAGHTHVDGMTKTSSDIPVFITTCDKYLPWVSGDVNKEPWLSENRTVGTITEQAFDVVVVDKTNRLISFVRIGAPADNGTGNKLEVRQQQY